MRKLGIDNGKPLMSRDLAEPLVGADDMVDGGGLMELKGDAELKGIESANLSLKAVVRNEFPGTDEVDVEQTEDLIPPASDVSREESTEPGEFENVKLLGADLRNSHGISSRSRSLILARERLYSSIWEGSCRTRSSWPS